MLQHPICRIRRANPAIVQDNQRSGFTLVELLIVVGILLLLTLMTVSAVNLSVNNDKVRAGARQVQSYLAGARDRAIYAQAPRGVRFLLDPTNNRTVSSMIFIQRTDPWTQGQIQLERLSTGANALPYSPGSLGADTPGSAAIVVRGYDNDPNNPFATPTNWVDLMNEGLLFNGARILIPNDSTGTWYTITTELLWPLGQALPNASPAGTTAANYYPPRLHLTTPYANSPTNTQNPAAINAFLSGGPITYLLELPNSVMPGAEPVLMPKGSVVHLDRCTSVGPALGIGTLEQLDAAHPPNRGDKLPSAWKNFNAGSVDPTGFDYTTQMDVLFSPRGVVIGPASQRGIIHLYIADQKDADRDRLVYWSSGSFPTQSAWEYGQFPDKYERGDKAVVSLFTRTGTVLTGNINGITGGVSPDPFKFAETGQVAGK